MENREERQNQLRALLLRERDQLANRIKIFRRDQAAEALTSPGDEMDRAKSLLDVETHASLIGRAEDQLPQIDEALARVDSGKYGICVNCGEEISLARLAALPFTPYCVDCKSSVAEKDSGPSRTEREAYHRWTPPAEIAEAETSNEDDGKAADELTVRAESESAEKEEATVTPHARRPRRKR